MTFIAMYLLELEAMNLALTDATAEFLSLGLDVVIADYNVYLLKIKFMDQAPLPIQQ